MLSGKKDELLERLDSGILLKLATSVSQFPIEGGATRAELIKIIKDSLSVEEIVRKSKQSQGASQLDLTGAELKAGAVGQVFVAISGAISTFGYYVVLTSPSVLSFYQLFAPWSLVSSVLVLLFAVLLTVSVRKMPREIGGRVGKATCLFGMITAIMGIVIYSLAIVNILDLSYTGASILMLSISISWPLATALVLLGAFFLVCRKYTGSSDLWIASGVLYIVSGGSIFGVTGLSVATSAPFVAAILGAVCFFTGKSREWTRLLSAFASLRKDTDEAARHI
jgi:hypothetical protein